MVCFFWVLRFECICAISLVQTLSFTSNGPLKYYTETIQGVTEIVHLSVEYLKQLLLYRTKVYFCEWNRVTFFALHYLIHIGILCLNTFTMLILNCRTNFTNITRFFVLGLYFLLQCTINIVSNLKITNQTNDFERFLQFTILQ